MLEKALRCTGCGVEFGACEACWLTHGCMEPWHTHSSTTPFAPCTPRAHRGYPRVTDALRKVDIEAVLFFLGEASRCGMVPPSRQLRTAADACSGC